MPFSEYTENELDNSSGGSDGSDNESPPLNENNNDKPTEAPKKPRTNVNVTDVLACIEEKGLQESEPAAKLCDACNTLGQLTIPISRLTEVYPDGQDLTTLVALREKPIARKVTRKGKRKADRAPTDTRYGKNPKTKEEAEAFKALLEGHPDLPKYEDAKKQAREILAQFADFKLAMQRANAILRKE